MSQAGLRQHPVLVAAAAIGRAVDEVVDVDPVFMSTADKAAALLALSREVDRLEELRMRVLAVAADVASEHAARDVAAWLAHHGRRDGRECRRRLALARSLAEQPATAAALRTGALTVAQAEVVVRAVEDLPVEVDLEVRTSAEERLVAEAGRFGPRALRVLGRRVVDVVAPDVGEQLEQVLLLREERRAQRRTFLTVRRNGDGTSDLHLRAADSTCDRLMTYLEAYVSPRRADDDRRPYAQRLGAAFGSFLESVDPSRLPLHGGDATTVLVTIDLAVLRGEAGVAVVGDEPIDAGVVRRLACTAGVLPLVLGGDSQLLDLGRRRRLFVPVQRKALARRYPTCASEGCDIPAAWCEAHHAGEPWARGGRTDLRDGVLLCSFHHPRAHDGRYRLDRLADGGVRFTRRT